MRMYFFAKKTLNFGLDIMNRYSCKTYNKFIKQSLDQDQWLSKLVTKKWYMDPRGLMLHDVIPNTYKHVHCVAMENRIVTDRRYNNILINKLYLSKFYLLYLFKRYKLLSNMLCCTYKLSNLSPKLMKLWSSGSSPLNRSVIILLQNKVKTGFFRVLWPRRLSLDEQQGSEIAALYKSNWHRRFNLKWRERILVILCYYHCN